MSSTLEATGSPVEQADSEDITRTFDYRSALQTSETVASAVLVVYDLTEGEKNVTSTVIPGSVTTTSPTVKALVKSLERGHKYRVECLATTSTSQKILAYIEIKCPL
jgi:hypothetical protein